MSDIFRTKIISLRDSYLRIADDTHAGVGIRPENTEAKLRAEGIDHVLKLYNKHFPVETDLDEINTPGL